MAEAVVSFVLEQLGELLVESIVQEAKFLCGVGGQVDAAKAELRQMRCFLKDADERARGGDESVRNWVAEIREATYDLEDAILTYAAEVTLRREGGFRNVLKRLVCLYCQGVKLHQLRSKIEGITTGISSLRSSLEAHRIKKLPTSGSDGASSSDVRRRELRRDYSHIVEPDIVGLDEDVNKLVACLTESRDSHRVVSICGMGGLGKTTLARKVYQHNKIRGHFDCVAWASISQQCQVSSVWKDILIKVSPNCKNEIRKMEDGEMCKKLYKILKGRKCLIVLDDIWTDEVWKRLSPAFPRHEKRNKILFKTRNKILLTTRNRNLALSADENGVIHEPRCLDNKESWELFEKVFTSESRSNHEELKKKKQLGREMLEHCGGLPLAIIVLRGLLSRKQSVFEWEAMQQNIKTYINKGNLIEQQGSQISGVSWVLGLSYDELPYHLKPCFMHLANFPEDHEMKVSELCQIWMAEGFVPSEEVGYECFHELAQRCMVLRGKMGSINGRIKTCRLHDLMRDLCLSKAQEENFVKVFDCSDRQEGVDSSSSTKVRRVAITFRKRNSVEEILFINKDCFLRSFICCDAHLISAVMKSLSNHFHLLRVLKLEKCEVIFPKEIGELTYLHFLSLKNSHVNLLPKSLCKLRYLQFIDLRISSSYNGIEDIVVSRFDQLKHLFLPVEMVPREYLIGFENFSNLQTLAGIWTSYTGLNLMAQLTNLTKLEVYFDKRWEGGVSFNRLRSLVIKRPMRLVFPNDNEENHDITPIISSCPQICKLKIRLMRLEKLPEASQLSQELVKLTLDQTFFMNDPMPTLEKLPKLRILRLVRVVIIADEIVCSSGGFPCLESLCFSELSMTKWRMEQGALPNLCHLSLDKCASLRTFPDCLQYITSLKEIVLGKHESDLVNTLKERGELHKLPGDLQFLLLTARSRQSDEVFEHAY